MPPSSSSRRCATVRRFYDAFSERDLPELLKAVHPDVTFEPILGVLYDRHMYRGHAEIAEWYEGLGAGWDGFESRVQDAAEVDGRVIAFIHLVAHRGDERLEADVGVECGFKGARISTIVGRDPWDVADMLGIRRP